MLSGYRLVWENRSEEGVVRSETSHEGSLDCSDREEISSQIAYQGYSQ